jgi:hypothetical protein
MDTTVISGAGSVASNVIEYTKWLKALLSSSGPISAEGHKAIKTSRILESDEEKPHTGPTTYALGWWRGVYQGEEWFMQ